MKAYNDGTNTPLIHDNNDRPQLGPVVVCREMTDEELRWPAWNENKTDVVVDTVARDANGLPELIEIAKEGIKAALKDCDHTQLADFAYPNDKSAWDTYRAALRADMAALNSMTYAQVQAYTKPVRPF